MNMIELHFLSDVKQSSIIVRNRTINVEGLLNYQFQKVSVQLELFTCISNGNQSALKGNWCAEIYYKIIQLI